MNNNTLLNHENQEVNMITLEEEYDLDGAVMTIWNTEKVVIIYPT